jgi:ATP-dependent protease ClpP protease subunit
MQAKYLAASTGQEEETIMRDFSRPKYFSPFEAADYGIIDQVGHAVTWLACGQPVEFCLPCQKRHPQ